jgi:hypothetical protein
MVENEMVENFIVKKREKLQKVIIIHLNMKATTSYQIEQDTEAVVLE